MLKKNVISFKITSDSKSILHLFSFWHIKEKYRNTKNPKYSDKKMELLLADSNSFDEKVPL